MRATACILSDLTDLDVYIHIERIQTALLKVARHALSRKLSGVAAQEPYGLPMPGGRRLREVHSVEGVLSEQGKVPLRDQIRILHGHILPRPSLYSILSPCALQRCPAYVSPLTPLPSKLTATHAGEPALLKQCASKKLLTSVLRRLLHFSRALKPSANAVPSSGSAVLTLQKAQKNAVCIITEC